MVAKVTMNISDAWLSLVERCVRDAEVAGSNPVASILGRAPLTLEKSGVGGLFLFLHPIIVDVQAVAP